MKKILITGHKGFIGSYLWNEMKNTPGMHDWQLDGIDFPDDIGDFKTDEIYDVVIHLAAFANLRGSFLNPDVFWENNVVKSQPIFDYCKENNIRLLYASSAGAHGWWQNPYAITKKVNEIQAPPNSVGMRFFNVWAEQGSRSDMLYRMLQEDTARYITKHKRDYIHVRDIQRAIFTLMLYPEYRGVIDIGSGKAIPVIDIAKAMGRDLPIKEDTPGEPDSLCADIGNLLDMGWHPSINMMDQFNQT